MLAVMHEIGFAEIALVEVAGGTLLSDSVLSAAGSGQPTLRGGATATAQMQVAGTGSTALLAGAIASGALSTVGGGIFSPQVGAIVSATLSAAGAAQVLWVSEEESAFAMAGTSSAMFAGGGRFLRGVRRWRTGIGQLLCVGRSTD